MAKPYRSVQVFKSPFLERFTHVHPITPLVVWAPVVAFLIWRSFEVRHVSFYQFGTAAFAGLVLWSLVEYILHRFVFHFESPSPFMKRFHFLIHGLHHVDPVDPTRLVMPPAASIVIAVILYSLFRTVLGEVLVEPFFAFFIIGYLCYDYIHFSVHHFTPRTRIGKYLKNSHMKHHFVCPNSRWGVSSPLWDYVFGTAESVTHKKQQAV